MLITALTTVCGIECCRRNGGNGRGGTSAEGVDGRWGRSGATVRRTASPVDRLPTYLIYSRAACRGGISVMVGVSGLSKMLVLTRLFFPRGKIEVSDSQGESLHKKFVPGLRHVDFSQICRHVDKFQICRSVDLSIFPAKFIN